MTTRILLLSVVQLNTKFVACAVTEFLIGLTGQIIVFFVKKKNTKLKLERMKLIKNGIVKYF